MDTMSTKMKNVQIQSTRFQSIFKFDEQLIKVVVFGNDKKYEVGQELNLYWDIEDLVVFGRDNNGK